MTVNVARHQNSLGGFGEVMSRVRNMTCRSSSRSSIFNGFVAERIAIFAKSLK